MHFLITGHSGFKGAWLALMLRELGHDVSGYSLDPLENSLFAQAELSSYFKHDFRGDIRNLANLKEKFVLANPDVIIHLAAQPLVRESYINPLETFDINVMGTLNVLEASKAAPELKAALIITTDKVYKNINVLTGYVETDSLGGEDPYSASKVAADIAAQSWIKNYANVPMAIARAGNVIGGGDFAIDRIVPDIIRDFSVGHQIELRYPRAIRPWQHVLDCLNGYLKLVDSMLSSGTTGEWNFGPIESEKHSVSDLVEEFAKHWPLENAWSESENEHLDEAGYLLLNSDKARSLLGWHDRLDFPSTVKWTNDWYVDQRSPIDRTTEQIRQYLDLI
jgi:CDP-glucose 4,6-dehydratase